MKMIKLERATLNDAVIITDINTKAFNDEIQTVLGRDGGPPGYNAIEENSRVITKFIAYIILFENRTIGSFFLIPHSREHYSLESFCIYPEYQNRGFGYQTLLEMEKMNCEVKKWTLESMKGSNRIQHLYEKFGYMQIGEDECFFRYEKLVKT